MSQITSNKPNVEFASKEIRVSLQTGTFTLVATGGIFQDVGNGFSITIPTTGTYRITCKYHADISFTTNNQNSVVARLAVNGVEVDGTVTQAYKNTTVGLSIVFPLYIEAPLQAFNAGDIITLQAYKTNTDFCTIYYSNGVYEGFIQCEMLNAIVPQIEADMWTSYVPAITGDTTNPTKGTIVTDIARWRRNGSVMDIIYNYQQSAAGASGSGYYSISLPAGYQIDSTIIPIGGYIAAGHGMCYSNGSAEYAMVVTTKTNTTFGLLRQGTSLAWIGSTVLGLGSANSVIYSFQASVPIVGW